jgi:hypothetical protein
MSIAYNFYIKIDQEGQHEPKMEFAAPYQELSHLGDDDYAHSQDVREFLALLQDEAHSEDFDFAPNDFVICEVEKDTVYVSSGFEAFETYTISRAELIKIYSDWLIFLELYENNQIPGFIFH